MLLLKQAIAVIEVYKSNKIIMDFVESEAPAQIATQVGAKSGIVVSTEDAKALLAINPMLNERYIKYVAIGLSAGYVASMENQIVELIFRINGGNMRRLYLAAEFRGAIENDTSAEIVAFENRTLRNTWVNSGDWWKRKAITLNHARQIRKAHTQEQFNQLVEVLKLTTKGE